jgi:hypothetical protein
MRGGIFISLILHAAALFAGVIAWNAAPPSPPMPPSIPISMVKIGPETNIIAARPKDPQDEGQVLPVPPQEDAGDPTPGTPDGDPKSSNLKPPPPREAVSEIPGPKKPQTPPQKPAAAAVDSKDKKAKPDTKTKKGMDFDQLAKLIDKAKQSDTAKTKTETPPNAPKEDVLGRKSIGKANAMAATAEDALREQLKRCWRAPIDQPNPERLVVSVRVYLSRDGGLAREPKLEKPNPLPVGDRGMVIASENALRAVRTCAPYDLPEESFDLWKEVVLRFDPREMLNQ